MELKKRFTLSLSKGFSLIELVVVIGLLALLTLAISSIMLTTIITSNRIRTTTKVKQAGSFAITQIQGMVRGSKDITTCDSVADSLTLVGHDGGSTDLAIELDGSVSRIASGSGNFITPASLDVTSFDLICEPSDDLPSLIKVSFDLRDVISTSARENPLLHFETSINLRN